MKATLALLLVALGSSNGLVQPLFPCGEVGPCVDDPTFLVFGVFPCDIAPGDPCAAEPAFSACALTCLSCPICTDPDTIPGFDLVIQVGLFDDVLVVYTDNAEDLLAGIQGVAVCLVGGMYGDKGVVVVGGGGDNGWCHACAAASRAVVHIEQALLLLSKSFREPTALSQTPLDSASRSESRENGSQYRSKVCKKTK